MASNAQKLTPNPTDESGIPSTAPDNAKVVLATLITVAAVANLPLAMANVALPTIGAAFHASQTQLNLVAVSYSLGLACSVLWLGALGDRYGRKLMLILGVTIAIPAALLAGFAPTIEIMIGARLLGGFAAGMAYPTTLALITALWTGPARTRTIALWAAIGAAVSAIGPLLAGLLLQFYDWRSVFVVVIPLAVVALFMAWKYVPAHVKETTEPVDNIGGILSVIFVGSFILAINLLPVPNQTTLALTLLAIAIVSGIAFFIRQRRARVPLYDLKLAARPTFWVAAIAGIIVFGALMGAMFVGQQFLQNVLGYDTVSSGFAILPAAIFLVLVAPRSAKLVETRGARFTLLAGYVFVLLGFLTMLFLWEQDIPYWVVGLGYAFVGIGVGLAGTPASRSLTGSVPVTRAGMASGTADLQRDLGGAIMLSLFGALLASAYAASIAAQIAAAPNGAQVSSDVISQLQLSFASATAIAAQYPEYSTQIITGAKTAFLAGDDAAYIAGIVSTLLGAVLVFFFYPKLDQERKLMLQYRAEDPTASPPPSTGQGTPVPAPSAE